jgi:uncharacterized membrane protein YwzB
MIELEPIVNVLLHFFGFFVAMYGLSAINFEKALRQGRTFQAQVLYIGLSMGLGYLIAQFLKQLMLP